MVGQVTLTRERSEVSFTVWRLAPLTWAATETMPRPCWRVSSETDRQSIRFHPIRDGALYILGSINLDIVTRVAALPRAGETVAALRTHEFPGGKGANQAVAAARMGAKVRLIAALGRDEAGEDLKTFMSGVGVDTEQVAVLHGEATGRAFICVEAGGENTIVVDGGANLALRPEHLPPVASLEHAVRLAQLETPLETVAAFFRAGSGSGLRMLNAAPARLKARDLFNLVDILILNETELQTFAELKTTPKSQAQIVAAARSLLVRPTQSVVVTLGAAGCLIVTLDAAQPIAGHAVSVVDTTGAGDCFCGVLAARLAEGDTLAEAAAMANAAAALAVGKAGAAISAPTRAELEAFLAG
jgi:ribokinase